MQRLPAPRRARRPGLSLPPRCSRRAALVVLGLAALAGIAVVAGSSARAVDGGRAAASASAAARPTSTSPAPSATTVGPPASVAPASAPSIELTVEAEVPIVEVRAPGLQLVELRGRTARILVSAWSGTLLVEVTLQRGGVAIARFEQGGARVSRLVSISPSAPAFAPPPSRARRPELQENPYR
jgi:hypothetical protein